MLSLLLALTAVAAVALVGSLAVRRRTRTRSSIELWSEAAGTRSLLARQRLLAGALPTVPDRVVRLPVGPGADGAQAARRLLERPEAA